MGATVRIDGLSKSFGAVKAVEDVSLEIAAGEVFFLLGPSGCGKTTLLRSIAGFYKPEAGRIFLDGIDVTALPPDRRDTAMVFQSYALWPHMTVLRNVEFGLEMRRISGEQRRQMAYEALRLVKMDQYAGRRPAELSGGQQQRAALARALVVKPRCLLLDEPLSNLDAKLRLEMRTEIRRLCKTIGVTAVYVTHDQKEALSIADRLAVMHAGRVIQTGTPPQVYRAPLDAFVAGFMGETNLLSAEVVSQAADNRLRVCYGAAELIGEWGGTGAVPSPGAGVLVSFRPECVLPTENTTEKNSFDGELIDSIFLGETAQYRIRINKGGNDEIKMLEINPLRIRECGQRIRVKISPCDLRIINA